MINKPLPQPLNIAPGQTAILTVATENLTLTGLKFTLSGTTFDKTKIDSLKVKLGTRTLWDLTYAQLQAINNYKNSADNLKYLYLDFVEREQAIFPLKEVGGIDLMTLAYLGVVTVEIKINASAVAPKIDVQGYYEQGQGNPIVLKYVQFTAAYNAGGRFTLPVSLKGAILKRLYVFFSGTGWTGTTNGNVSRMECKKNSMVFFDEFDTDNRFMQSHYKKVPQAGLYVCDFIVDNNHDAQITTARLLDNGQYAYDAFEFNAYITDAGGAAMTIIAEVLDAAENL
ncbi:major capsid protein P2 [Pseudoduganella sp. UC29_71]|uniref:major capsid protein P2 n=1 Tax=Pseudoduganella sp. UC29_71 TaxID=3350174 RepID=UPI00366B04D8